MAEFPPYPPQIKNPYPASWRNVSDFDFTDHLYMARAKEALMTGTDREAEYLVFAEYHCSCRVDAQPWGITVPSGMLTDLTSVPWYARWLVGRVGPHLEAAIVHDFLFIAWQDIEGGAPREQDFRFANRVMLQAMIAADVSWLRRSLIYWAVSLWIARRAYFEPKPEVVRYVRIPEPDASFETAAATERSATA